MFVSLSCAATTLFIFGWMSRKEGVKSRSYLVSVSAMSVVVNRHRLFTSAKMYWNIFFKSIIQGKGFIHTRFTDVSVEQFVDVEAVDHRRTVAANVQGDAFERPPIVARDVDLAFLKDWDRIRFRKSNQDITVFPSPMHEELWICIVQRCL